GSFLTSSRKVSSRVGCASAAKAAMASTYAKPARKICAASGRIHQGLWRRQVPTRASLSRRGAAMIDFETINHAALPVLPAILNRLIPGGKILGREYVALNPTRADRCPGSFKVNLRTGRWADFA